MNTEENMNSSHEEDRVHFSSEDSQDEECVICLETKVNRVSPNTCFHSFCCECLKKWSSVKPVCPLCGKQFGYIVTNDTTFSGYRQCVKIEITYPIQGGLNAEGASSYPTLPPQQSAWMRRHEQFANSIEYATHRVTYAPHSVAFPDRPNFTFEYQPTNYFRRRVYVEGLWVKPLERRNWQRHRIPSPEFYCQYPIFANLLTSWLNRELSVLLNDSEIPIPFVLELILSLIVRYDICSEEFHNFIEPYFGIWTEHFIHEFFSYASSLRDMTSYDNSVVYGNQQPASENNTNVLRSPENNAVPDASPSTSKAETKPSLNVIDTSDSSSNHHKKKTMETSNIQPKPLLKISQDRNILNSPLSSCSSTTSSQFLRNTSAGDSIYNDSSFIHSRIPGMDINPGSSTTGLGRDPSESEKITSKKVLSADQCSGSFPERDDCVIVDVLNTRVSRGPVIVVDLASSSGDEENTGNAHNSSVKHEEEEIDEEISNKEQFALMKGISSSSFALQKDPSSYGNSSSTVQLRSSTQSRGQAICPSMVTPSVCEIQDESKQVTSDLSLIQNSLNTPASSSDERHMIHSPKTPACSPNSYISVKMESPPKSCSKATCSEDRIPDTVSPVSRISNNQDGNSSTGLNVESGSNFDLKRMSQYQENNKKQRRTKKHRH